MTPPPARQQSPRRILCAVIVALSGLPLAGGLWYFERDPRRFALVLLTAALVAVVGVVGSLRNTLPWGRWLRWLALAVTILAGGAVVTMIVYLDGRMTELPAAAEALRLDMAQQRHGLLWLAGTLGLLALALLLLPGARRPARAADDSFAAAESAR